MKTNFFFSVKSLALLVFILGASYFFNIKYALYWQYPWIDIPLHFLGGVVAALAVSLIFRAELVAFRPLTALLFIIGLAVLIGVGWEFFEWTLDHTVRLGLKQGDLTDTLTDLLMDILGASFTALNLNWQRRT